MNIQEAYDIVESLENYLRVYPEPDSPCPYKGE